MLTEDAATDTGGGRTNGPPSRPPKGPPAKPPKNPPPPQPPTKPPSQQWMTVNDVVAEAQKSDETVYAALRRGHLKGSHSSAKAPWRIRRDHFNDWMSRGAPAWRAA